ncbi:unnamed protein product [Polarella glacialis]|uniref:Uncharacterized protein n=1 Tax=Polarella glacialis TaxID=89957 RepID=A0A813K1U6_POLGL|nr:unnamed protein product [Polarella glacialis]CAE8690248.1 unnamed protein product [Polarella glacialis]
MAERQPSSKWGDRLRLFRVRARVRCFRKRRDDLDDDLLTQDLESDPKSREALEAESSVLHSALFLTRSFFADPLIGRRAICLSAVSVILLLAEISCFLYFSKVQGNYMTALQQKDVDGFYHGLWMVGVVIMVISPIIALHEYTGGVLRMWWRSSLTKRLAKSYLSNSGAGQSHSLFYRLAISGEIDNPDQRICQDIADFVDVAFRLVQDTLRTFLSIMGFAGVLYSISPMICVYVVVYALFGTLVSALGFGPWIAHFQHKRVRQEADLRYGLIRVRENAESVAFFRGGEAEWSNFSDHFTSLLDTIYKGILVSSGYSVFNRTFHWATFAVSPLLVGPAYLRGEVPFGAISQTSMAFGSIFGGLTLIMDRIESLSNVAVRIRRLQALELALQRGEDNVKAAQLPGFAGKSCIASQELSASDPAVLRLREVTLLTPPRNEVIQQTLSRQLSLELCGGQSLLIVGESGIGKSSLLRAIAGLWSDGSGHIDLCSRDSVFFMPQKPYMFLGSLRDQLLYPHVRDSITTDAQIVDALRQVNLGSLLDHHNLSDTKDWASLLSLGQQQRINFARVLLRPQVQLALIDEGTSACDPANEAQLYRLLQQRLRSYVSVGHRPALQQFHSHVLWMSQAGQPGQAGPVAEASSAARQVSSGPTSFRKLTMAEYQQANLSNQL